MCWSGALTKGFFELVKAECASTGLPVPARTGRPRPAKWRRRRPGKLAGPVALAAAIPLSLVGSHTAGATNLISGVLTSSVQTATTSPSDSPATTPGEVGAFGDASSLGGPGASLAKPLTGIAADPAGSGYWLVGADGGIFNYGSAPFYGSAVGAHLTAPIVGIAATPDGRGYWLVGSDGGIFSFGDAGFQGSQSPEPSGTRVVGIAATSSGSGYWLPTAPPSQPSVSVQNAALVGPGGTPLGDFVVTCYDLQGDTATGVPTNSATVAVDPSVIPLGSHIYVNGVGPRIAEDTGGAIVGRRLDIWEPTYSQCVDWGVQTQQVWMQG